MARIGGDLDLVVSADLRRRLDHAVSDDTVTTVLLDLSEVGFVDAHCIGLIVSARTEAAKRGRTLEVVGLQGLPARVFGLLGLDSVMVRQGYGGKPGGR